MKKDHGKEFNSNLSDEQTLKGAEPVLGEQSKGKDSSVDGNEKASAGDFDYSPKRMDNKGSSIKQEVVAKALSSSGTGSSGGEFSPYGSGMRSIPYSGSDARIIDNASGTPAFNKSDRSDSRYGQKNDNTARHINNVPSETYLIGTDGPKPLSDSADKVQGSLGHPANEFARIQKCSEGFPGALNFERSIDEITDDVLIYAEGQQIKYVATGESYDDIDPTETYDKDTNKKVEYSIHRGNYIPRTVHVKYDNNGVLTDYYYDEDSAPVTISGDLQTERANTHTIMAANRAEIDRQNICIKAGNEVQPDWSGIGYVYNQPTKDVLYMSTLEKQIGANIYVPIKMACKSHSYALNKAVKDGLRPVSGGVEICLGPVISRSSSVDYDSFGFSQASESNSVFNSAFTSKGAPSAIIAMNDSIAKYHDRADVLTQPRSFNMVLKQGISKYKDFRIDPEFAHIFDNLNVFSTIDRGYDPSSPVCIADTIGIINPYSFNELGSCYRQASISKIIEEDFNAGMVTALYTDTVKTMTVDDGTTSRVFEVLPSVQIKLTSGSIEDYDITDADYEVYAKIVRRWAFKKFGHEAFTKSYALPLIKKVAAVGDREDHAVFICYNFNNLPIPDNDETPDLSFTYGTSSTETATANSATFDYAHEFIYNDYLAVFYKNRQNYYYIELRDAYTDGIKEFLRRNYGIISKIVDDNKSFDWPIHYSTKSFSAYSYLVMMSLKYITEQRSKAMLDVINYSNNFGYPFSDCDQLDAYSVLGGPQYEQSDIFERLSPRQMSPNIAIRWTHPELYTKLVAESDKYRTLMPFYMNEDSYKFEHVNSQYKLSLDYERAAMSYPVTKYGTRWSYSDDLYGFDERDLRLLLDMIIAPPSFAGADSCLYQDSPEVYKYSQANEGLVVIPADITQKQLLSTARELGYVCPVVGGYLFPEPGTQSTVTHIDSRCNINTSIVGHSAFRAVCYVIESGTPATQILQQGSSIISRAANFSQKYYIFNTNEDHPGTSIGLCLSTDELLNSTAAGGVDNVSYFIPFTDGVFTARGQTVLSRPKLFNYAKGLWTRFQRLPFAFNPFDFGGNVDTDPYSFNYIFGLLGFKSSDYKEDLYNRLTKRMADGWQYISDPFVEASLLIKG